jgi:hypothetical protein
LKRALTILIFLTGFIACRKDSLNHTTFSFKANGVHYEWDGSLADTIYYSPPGGSEIGGIIDLALYASPANRGFFSFDVTRFVIYITNDTVLQEKTYVSDTSNSMPAAELHLSDSNSIYATQQYETDRSGTTSLSITITKIRDKSASGFFSAHLTNGMSVTEGKFANVPITR